VVLTVLGVVLTAVALAALFVGGAGLSASAVARALAGRAEASSVEAIVTLSLRLPRVAVAVLAGAALAVAGVGFQALTRNPLAEPSILGVSSGAAFGVVLAQILGFQTGILAALGVAVFAFGARCSPPPSSTSSPSRPAASRCRPCSWPASSSGSSSRRRSP